jgi:hypothetical protein
MQTASEIRDWIEVTNRDSSNYPRGYFSWNLRRKVRCGTDRGFESPMLILSSLFSVAPFIALLDRPPG